MKTKVTYSEVKAALKAGFVSPLNHKMTRIEVAKKSCKEYGVKGFRKLKLKRELYTIGKQCTFINKFIAVRMIASLEKLGFEIKDKKTCLSLNEKGLLDTITIGFN